MHVLDDHFNVHKKNAVEKYQHAKKNNMVDTALVPTLDCINSFELYFTTSSCAGRILLLQLPKIGDKKQAIFLGKWHRMVTLEEVAQAISKYDSDQLWLLGQPPIFHIGCQSIDAADAMIKLGISSGFKHSGVKSMHDQIIVELCSTERIDTPLGEKGLLLVDKQYLVFLVSRANKLITRTKAKLNRFERNLKSFSP